MAQALLGWRRNFSSPSSITSLEVGGTWAVAPPVPVRQSANMGTGMQKSSHGQKVGHHGGCSWRVLTSPGVSHPHLPAGDRGAARRSFAFSNGRGAHKVPSSDGPAPAPTSPADAAWAHREPLSIILGKVQDRCFCRQPTATAGRRLKNGQCSHENASCIFDLVFVCQ